MINGTLNLNLGGNVDAFEAVIGEPPATSSELTLIQALGKINQVLQKNTTYKTNHWLWLSLLLPYVLLFIIHRVKRIYWSIYPFYTIKRGSHKTDILTNISVLSNSAKLSNCILHTYVVNKICFMKAYITFISILPYV